mmetsp:Transcript_2608/g.4806  ORF Transcript_2608/g.4806 Transcript_2608/m.4806 type:complete len:223 (+) Transcript_2608:290-958(+)
MTKRMPRLLKKRLRRWLKKPLRSRKRRWLKKRLNKKRLRRKRRRRRRRQTNRLKKKKRCTRKRSRKKRLRKRRWLTKRLSWRRRRRKVPKTKLCSRRASSLTMQRTGLLQTAYDLTEWLDDAGRCRLRRLLLRAPQERAPQARQVCPAVLWIEKRSGGWRKKTRHCDWRLGRSASRCSNCRRCKQMPIGLSAVSWKHGSERPWQLESSKRRSATCPKGTASP